MNPKQVNPALAANLGWDVKQMNDTEKVTVVRRRVVYEESVLTKKEFEKMNNLVKDSEDFFLNHLEMKDIQFSDFAEEETSYTAFPGDVTSFTDDAISFLFENKIWTDAYEPIKVAS